MENETCGDGCGGCEACSYEPSPGGGHLFVHRSTTETSCQDWHGAATRIEVHLPEDEDPELERDESGVTITIEAECYASRDAATRAMRSAVRAFFTTEIDSAVGAVLEADALGELVKVALTKKGSGASANEALGALVRLLFDADELDRDARISHGVKQTLARALRSERGLL